MCEVQNRVAFDVATRRTAVPLQRPPSRVAHHRAGRSVEATVPAAFRSSSQRAAETAAATEERSSLMGDSRRRPLRKMVAVEPRGRGALPKPEGGAAPRGRATTREFASPAATVPVSGPHPSGDADRQRSKSPATAARDADSPNSGPIHKLRPAPAQRPRGPTCKFRDATCKRNGPTWKLEAATCKLDRATWKLEPGTCKLEHGTCKLERPTWKLERGTSKLEPST